jgi:hypothetical protein
MSQPPLDERGEAHEALNSAVVGYGARVLGSPQILGNLVTDLLPDLPRERSLLVAAAEAGVASELSQHVEEQHIDADTAVQLVARGLAERKSIDATASMWVTTEYARALGYSAQPFVQPAAQPGQAGPGPIGQVGPVGQVPEVTVPPPGTAEPTILPPGPGQPPIQQMGTELADYGDRGGAAGGQWPGAGGTPAGGQWQGQGGGAPAGGQWQGPGGTPAGGQWQGQGGGAPAGGQWQGPGGAPPGGQWQGTGGTTAGRGPGGGGRGRLIAIVAGVAVLAVYLTAAAAGHIFPFSKASSRPTGTASGPGPTKPVSPKPDVSPVPVPVLPGSIPSLIQLLPSDLDQTATECPLQPPPYKWHMPGLVKALSCTDPGLPGGLVFAYQMDSSADFETAWRNFNTWWGFNLSSAGTTCPPPGSSLQGTTGWNNNFFPQTDGQSLECEWVGTNSDEPAYAWAFPTDYAFIVAQGKAGSAFTKLDAWWTHHASQTASPTPAAP